jgi:hypothetical protein
VPNGQWTVGELGRALDTHEKAQERELAEIREEVRWTRRLLLGTLGAALLASLISAAVGIVGGP